MAEIETENPLVAYFKSTEDTKAVISRAGKIIYPEDPIAIDEVACIAGGGTSIPGQYFFDEQWYARSDTFFGDYKVISFRNITHIKVASDTDITTGLPVKKALVLNTMAYLKGLMAKTSDDKGFAFIMADIDNFKFVNDNYGHGFGDIVLNRVAQLLAQKSRIVSNPDYERRATDIVGRFGGEEFTIVWKNISFLDAEAKLQSILETINKTRILYGGAGLEIPCPTVSFGLYYVSKEEFERLLDSVSGFPEEEVLQALWDVLVCISDKVLYVSKNTGKNRFTSTTDLEEDILASLPEEKKLEYMRHRNV